MIISNNIEQASRLLYDNLALIRSAALLEFLAAATRTRIVASHLRAKVTNWFEGLSGCV